MATIGRGFVPHSVLKRPRLSRGKSPIYSTSTWTRVSKVIRRRDPMCKVCNERPSTQVDHITAINDGGEPFDPANLQGICSRCHHAKSHRERLDRGQL